VLYGSTHTRSESPLVCHSVERLRLSREYAQRIYTLRLRAFLLSLPLFYIFLSASLVIELKLQGSSIGYESKIRVQRLLLSEATNPHGAAACAWFTLLCSDLLSAQRIASVQSSARATDRATEFFHCPRRMLIICGSENCLLLSLSSLPSLGKEELFRFFFVFIGKMAGSHRKEERERELRARARTHTPQEGNTQCVCVYDYCLRS
jgi:hypothetical protein